MPLAQAAADRARDLLARAPHIHVVCHRNPDGDAIGSLLAAGMLFEEHFTDARVSFHCVDPVPEIFSFLPGARRVTVPTPMTELEPGRDAFVFVDSAEPKLTDLHASHAPLFAGEYTTVNIDHHHGNPGYGRENLIIPDASSTCEVLLEWMDLLGWKPTPDIATCLLTGIYTDTGGLLHSNTTAAVYRAVARLLRAGARRQSIVTAVFRTAKLSTLRLWGRVLEKISITEEGGAVSAVTEGDFRATGAQYSELTGAIDYVNAIPGMRFSLILSERGGAVKGSLRTLRDDVDVSAMAGTFKGGGHRKAAGFSLPGHLRPELRWKVVEENSDAEKSRDTASSLS